MQGKIARLSLCVILGVLAAGLVFIPSIGAQEDLTSGPYVDKLVFIVIEDEDQQVFALQSDEIDLIGDKVSPVHVPILTEAESIDVVSTPRNGYGYITINCDRYPLNITALRRALAFGLDKYAVSADVWDGMSVPQDSCVPQVNPWSIEGLMPYTYYDENLAKGHELLDAAGFEYDEDTGWRRAPNGEPFDITVEVAITSPIALECGEIVAQTLRDLGIDAVNEPPTFDSPLSRLYFKNSTGYDIIFLGSSFRNFDVDWLAYSFWGEYADEDYYNLPRFRNDTYDSYRDALLYSTDYDEILAAAHGMQEILIYESPMIILYNSLEYSAYRTDRFEGHVNTAANGVPSWWTNYRVHLKDSEGGLFGGTFRWSNSQDVDTFNFMDTSSTHSMNVLSMLYDSLLRMGPDGSMIPWLAEEYRIETHADNPAIPEGHTRITFDMIQNATWTDGTPLTAEDLAFSINYYRDAPGNPYGADLVDVTAAYAPTAYRAIIEFKKESYWHLQKVAFKSVFPRHIFVDMPLAEWNNWDPVPPVDEMVTSGPFTVTEYSPGEFVELTRNPYYFYKSDSVSPTIDSPEDIEYLEGTTGHNLIWSPSDANPWRYEVYRNGSIIDDGYWDGSQISVSVDGLTLGTYNYTLVVYDTYGNWNSNTVFVTVLLSIDIPRMMSVAITVVSIGIIIVGSSLIIRERKRHPL